MYGLSKSRIMNGVKCPRLLWVQVHQPELVVYDQSAERLFAIGHDVGRVARQLHPDGVFAGTSRDEQVTRQDLRQAVLETKDLLAGSGDLTVFEATFTHDGVLARADLLFREGGRCRFTEVKASSS
jgi:hypothetical protein